MQVLCKEEG